MVLITDNSRGLERYVPAKATETKYIYIFYKSQYYTQHQGLDKRKQPCMHAKSL